MRQRLGRIVGLAAAALALALNGGCAAEKRLPTPQPRIAASPYANHPGPAMWRVADEDTTIYLFGTIHFLPAGVNWLDDHLESALQSSSEMVTEIDPADTAELAEMMANSAYLPAGENLREMLPREKREAFEGLLVSLGIPIEQFDRYKPWSAGLYLSVLLMQIAGYDATQGVEQVLTAQMPAGATRSALETVDFQLELFNSLGEEEQVAYLGEVVNSATRFKPDLDSMLTEWMEGDAAALAALMNFEESDPELYRHMLTDRNAKWAQWIEHRLDRPGTVFIAVGAGHLAGKGSVQEQLAGLGIKSSRVH